MSMDQDDALRGAIRHGLDPLLPAVGFEPRVQSRLREHATGRHRRAPRTVLSVAVSAALVAALVCGFVATRGSSSRIHTVPQGVQVLRDLTSGASAAPVPDATSNYVWLTADGTGPACTIVASPGASRATYPAGYSPPPVWDSPAPSPCAGPPDCLTSWSLPSPSADTVCGELVTEVDVLDWTGTLRHHFQISPPETAEGATNGGIASISPDGTRALLDDGTVLDQTGRTVGDLAAVGSLLASSETTPLSTVAVHWLSDDTGVCVAGPAQLLGGSTSTGQTATGTTLEVVRLTGTTRTVATLATGQTGWDETSIDACDPATDTATISVFGGQANPFGSVSPAATATPAATASPAATPSNVIINAQPFGPDTVSVWSVRLSTGGLLYHQTPAARPDEGQAWTVGSGDGSLAAELTWNSEVAGCNSLEVVDTRLTQPLPIAAPLICPDVPAMSADGTRFVVRDINAQADNRTTLDLVDGSDGSVVRSVQLPGNFSVDAVAAPSGADFMLLVDGYLVLVDQSGGMSQLHPAGLDLAKPTSLSGVFDFAGEPPGYAQG
jgi:hypothetical protein